MNKLEELEKKYEELGKEIEKLKKKDSFTAGWYAYWDNNDTSKAIEYYIDFIRTNESLNDRLSNWDNVVKIDKDAFDKLLKPKTIYDWSKIPEWATIAIMDIDGNISCGDYETATFSTDDNCWWGRGSSRRGWVTIEEDCILNPPDDWKNSLERRPE